jgi:glycosyltransferase involved in cell wall biosynthesis
VPVLCTRTGGIPELVEDGVSGILCEVGDYKCMARSAIALLCDVEKHRAMGIAARRRAVDLFPEDRIVSLYEALYREVVAR